MNIYHAAKLSVLAVGIILVLYGISRNKTSSFEDGSFITEIMLIITGAVLIAASFLWSLIDYLFAK